MKQQWAAKMMAMVVAGSVMGSAGMAVASDGATAKEAEAMVKKGVAYMKSDGKDKGFAEISNKQGRFIDRDLYLTATRLDGAVMAHGANEKLIGKSLIELKDIEGKEFIREMVETAKTKSGYWIDYKFTNPVSKKVEPKSMYCERFEDIAVCGGIYKK